MLTIQKIEKAAKRLQGVAHKTPLQKSSTFSKMANCDVYLKYENLQKTGAFKIRGAYNKISELLEEKKPSEVVAASAGNHAQGVAWAATKLGINATIVMPKATPIAKIKATEDYGANVVLHGSAYDDAYNKALEIQKEKNAEFFLKSWIIAAASKKICCGTKING